MKRAVTVHSIHGDEWDLEVDWTEGVPARTRILSMYNPRSGEDVLPYGSLFGDNYKERIYTIITTGRDPEPPAKTHKTYDYPYTDTDLKKSAGIEEVTDEDINGIMNNPIID